MSVGQNFCLFLWVMGVLGGCEIVVCGVFLYCVLCAFGTFFYRVAKCFKDKGKTETCFPVDCFNNYMLGALCTRGVTCTLYRKGYMYCINFVHVFLNGLGVYRIPGFV